MLSLAQISFVEINVVGHRGCKLSVGIGRDFLPIFCARNN